METLYRITDIIDFATWYSGMDKSKVISAYHRYLKEVPQTENEKQLLPPQTGERGVLYEILWKHVTNMMGDETVIPTSEIESIIDCILEEYKNQ